MKATTMLKRRQLMTWNLVKRKNKIWGFDNFIVSVNNGKMKISCFEILESLPRVYSKFFRLLG